MEWMIIIALIMLAVFGYGNFIIISAVFGGNNWLLSEQPIWAFLAAIMDMILLCLVITNYKASISSSFRLARRGFKNRAKRRKKSAEWWEESVENEELYVNRLKELRTKGISENATKRTYHFCQLIESIAGKEQLQNCMAEVGEKQRVLNEIRKIENRILKRAEDCKNAGDAERSLYYLGLIQSTKKTPEIASIRNDCELLIAMRDKETKALELWKTVASVVLIILITIIFVFVFRRMLAYQILFEGK